MNKLLTNRKFNKVIKFIELIFVILIILYLIFILLQKISINSSIAGYRVVTIPSSSMEPDYSINDVVIVKDVEPEVLKVCDDITYKGERGGLEGVIVTHRIIKIEKSENGVRYYTQGINAKNPDPSFTEDRILGKAVTVLPVVTQVNRIVTDQFGFFFFVFCPLIFIIFFEITETILYIKLEKEELSFTQYIITQVKNNNKGKKSRKKNGKGTKKTNKKNEEKKVEEQVEKKEDKKEDKKDVPVLIESTIETLSVDKEDVKNIEDSDVKEENKKEDKSDEKTKEVVLEETDKKEEVEEKTKEVVLDNKKNSNEKEIPVLLEVEDVSDELI